MLWLTGDTHAEFERFGNNRFSGQPGDTIIICGDFGGIWDGSAREKWWLHWLSEKPYTFLFCDGNHENFDMLYSYPVSEWNGGKVHFIAPNIIHLMRGQIYTVEGHTFFVMGGASSHDIYNGVLDPDDPEYRKKKKALNQRHAFFRVKGRSWWPQELPSEAEYAEAEENLNKVGHKVDFIITHAAPNSVEARVLWKPGDVNELTQWLEMIRQTVQFRCWFFGHYHQCAIADDGFVALYEHIYPLDMLAKYASTNGGSGRTDAEPAL